MKGGGGGAVLLGKLLAIDVLREWLLSVRLLYDPFGRRLGACPAVYEPLREWTLEVYDPFRACFALPFVVFWYTPFESVPLALRPGWRLYPLCRAAVLILYTDSDALDPVAVLKCLPDLLSISGTKSSSPIPVDGCILTA